MDIRDLQIVVLEDLKDVWTDPDVRELYCDLMQIKFDGYGAVYGDNVVSSDKADFFGTHLLVCQKGIRLKPIYGYKSVSLDKSKEFHLTFPALSLVQADGHKECLDELQRIIKAAQLKGENLSFDYSWAQDTSIKEIRTKEMAQLFRDITMAVGVSHHRDYGINHMITCGVVKVKTDLFFEKMGLKKISSRSEFPQKDLNDNNVHIFHTSKFSDYAYEMAAKYSDLWENRINISKTDKKSSIIKAA